METQYDIDDILNDVDLQDWQKQILINYTNTTMKLQPKQKEMIQALLTETKYTDKDIIVKEKLTLVKVLVDEEYSMEEKKVLNKVRELYING